MTHLMLYGVYASLGLHLPHQHLPLTWLVQEPASRPAAPLITPTLWHLPLAIRDSNTSNLVNTFFLVTVQLLLYTNRRRTCPSPPPSSTKNGKKSDFSLYPLRHLARSPTRGFSSASLDSIQADKLLSP
jgi:hypothetical protein